MNSSPSAEIKKSSVFARYEGLDSFRVISSFYVVLGHAYISSGSIPELKPFLRIITFSFPFIVMSSFFVLTRALLAKPDITFKQFFVNSAKRLWIPMFVWTMIYSVFWGFVFPLVRSKDAFVFPPLTRIFSGYMHLWFLEFLFVGSLLLYLLLWLRKKRKISRLKIVFVSAALTIGGEVLFNHFFQPDKARFKMANVLPGADESLNILISSTILNFFFVLPAVCLALYADEINHLFQKRLFRIISLALVFVCAAVHMSTDAVPYSREIYTLAVFIAALQPWKFPSNTIRLIATYSYAIYILHYALTELLSMFIDYKDIEPTAGFVLFWSVVIYSVSLTAAILLRKFFARDWFLPLIQVGYAKKPKSSPAEIKLPVNAVSELK